MLVPFSELPSQSRVWVYQSSKKLTPTDVSWLQEQLSAFLQEWTAHGADLKAGFDIKYDRFITIGLDQQFNAASGCSIDTQVRFIQFAEKELEIELLDKMNVTYIQNDRVHYKELLEFKKMAKDGAVSKKTIVFNNLINTKGEYEEHWEVPAIESWHARFFK